MNSIDSVIHITQTITNIYIYIYVLHNTSLIGRSMRVDGVGDTLVPSRTKSPDALPEHGKKAFKMGRGHATNIYIYILHK